MHYLIDFKNDTSQEAIDAYFVDQGLTVLKTFNNFEKVYHVEAQIDPVKTDIIEFIVRDDDSPLQLLNTIIVADKNYGKIVTDGSIPTIDIANNDQNWWKFFSLNNADLDSPSYTINRRGKGALIYVLDSGIELSHSEFEDADVHNLFSFNGDFTDTAGHGTAIASVIAGKTCGITNSTVKSVKIFDKNQSTKQSDMLKALDAIIQDFSQSPEEWAIVNCSWSIPKNIYLEDKIRQMVDFGILFVCSAGNNGSPIDDITPAGMNEVITIGSYNHNLKPSDFSSYTGSGISITQGATNHGELDGWAPGEKIYAAGLGNTYHYVAGTSIAAGIHSSVVAYNLSLSFTNPLLGVSVVTFLSGMSLGRRNLLDLSDPKYQNSVNKISTFWETIIGFGSGIPLLEKAKSTSGSIFATQLFSPYVVQSLEILSPLPDGWVITPHGKFFGRSPVISERFTVITVPMKVTYHEGDQTQFNFKMVVTASDYDEKTESTGDPYLDIVLAEDVVCQYGTKCFDPNTQMCLDYCYLIGGFGSFCIQTGPGYCGGGYAKNYYSCGCN